VQVSSLGKIVDLLVLICRTECTKDKLSWEKLIVYNPFFCAEFSRKGALGWGLCRESESVVRKYE
jgi:hypothetical protein